MHETLRHLEKVTVRHERSKVHIELVGAIGFDLLLFGLNIEWVFHKLPRSLVKYLKNGPINANWEHKFILNCNCFRLANSTSVCELKVNRINVDLKFFGFIRNGLQHLLVQDDLAWVVNWNLQLVIGHIIKTVD